ncbi:MAG: heavy metal translocating P-type ATPase [Phycisphaerae bacterium]
MSEQAGHREVRLRITGMTCGACSARVAKALHGVRGVSDVSVNLMTESAHVCLDREDASPTKLLEAVRAAGYDAETIVAGADQIANAADNPQHQEQSRRHRQAMIQAVGLGLPIIALEYARNLLWTPDPVDQIPCRLMQIALLVMLAISPGGGPILAGGLRAAWYRSPNMDLLITMGAVVAFVSSLYGTFTAQPEFIQLHAAAMILALVCVGRYLEARAKHRASAAMTALARRAPKSALVRRGDRLVSVPVDDIVVGDLISTPVHTAIPVDGEVVEGVAAVDESLMTGEPLPVRRSVGDPVRSGTIVEEGVLLIRATAVGRASALGRILRLVSDAQAGHTPMQRLADRIAGVFAPAVIAAAALVFAGWLVAGGRAADATRAAVAVLVVACPCALGLATPTVVLVASGLAALRGILVRDAAMLEAMGRIDVVVWDKTGTLTAGRPQVRTVTTTQDWDDRAFLEVAASAEQFSVHPLARAIVARAKRDDIPLSEPTAFESVPGDGVSATVDGRSVLVGSRRFLASRGAGSADLADLIDPARHDDDTTVAVAIGGRLAGVIFLTDTIRPSSADAVGRIGRLGARNEMATGDAEETARAVAAVAGIDRHHAGLTPEDKVALVKELQGNGRCVAMVGDGVNDAAALAAADVGIAFATGADVAGEAAGIHLVGSTPHLVADAMELARASVRVIRQNLIWAFVYNVAMIPLAATAKLPPGLAAGAMMVSSLTVVLNALRLPRVLGWRSDC